MEEVTALPGWLEKFRAGDDVFAHAWDSAGAEDRALLKTAIAWHFHRWGLSDASELCERRSPREGFCTRVSTQPVDWVLAILSPGFSSPARLLATLVPALIAGVAHPAVLSVGEPAGSVAAALELAGIEDLFITDVRQAGRLAGELQDRRIAGRLILFPWTGNDSADDDVSELFRSLGKKMRAYSDSPRPSLLITEQPSGISHAELNARLLWLHPDARILDNRHEAQSPDAVYGVSPCSTGTPLSASMLFGSGMEACWTGPSPDFFRARRCAAFLTMEDEA